MKTLQERFEEKFEKVSGCWDWKVSKTQKGYGHFGFSGRILIAHRFAWELYVGEIPEGLCVLHHCDNPGCVNPSHLFLGTHTDNAHDRDNKSRGSYGEKRPNAKLTSDKAKEIRMRWSDGARIADLGREFGVTHQTISTIVHYRKWRRASE